MDANRGRPCPGTFVDDVLLGASCYGLTLLVIWVGASFGWSILDPEGRPADPVIAGAKFLDGGQYVAIAIGGYRFDSAQSTNTGWFPAYPLAGRAVMWVTGLGAPPALWLVAHLFLLGAFILLAAYVRGRFPGEPPELTDFAVLALGLWPTTLFFRIAYTESMFLLVTLLAMYGMHRQWRPIWIALIAGLATATRGPGLALLPVFAWYLWERTKPVNPQFRIGDPERELSAIEEGPVRRIKAFLPQAVWLLPLACWGLIAFMIHLHLEFGDALVFVRAHKATPLTNPESWPNHAITVLTLEPIRSIYDPSSTAYWARRAEIANPIFSLLFANPIYFLLAAVLILVGAWRRWLNVREILLGAFLLLIPYVTLGDQNMMLSHGRFASVAFPVYIVLGHLARRAPPVLVCGLFGLSALFLGIYASLRAAGYPLI